MRPAWPTLLLIVILWHENALCLARHLDVLTPEMTRGSWIHGNNSCVPPYLRPSKGTSWSDVVLETRLGSLNRTAAPMPMPERVPGICAGLGLKVRPKPRTLYDGFTYYNESAVVRLRLGVLAGIVDHTIVVEAVTDYRGRPLDRLFWKDVNPKDPSSIRYFLVDVDQPHTKNFHLNIVAKRNKVPPPPPPSGVLIAQWSEAHSASRRGFVSQLTPSSDASRS